MQPVTFVPRCQLWVRACKRADLLGKDVNQFKNMHICSLHFEHHMYGNLLLKKSAVPTLNLPTLATKTASTQTDNPDAHMALHILTSQGVQTEGECGNSAVNLNQFLKACDSFLPRCVGSFVKAHIYLADQNP